MKVTLSQAIEAHGEQVKELTFRAPKVGDFRGTKVSINEDGLNLDVGALLDLAAKLANVPPSSFDKLNLSDLAAIVGEVVPLLEGLLPVGNDSAGT